jgi:hypothetical protein
MCLAFKDLGRDIRHPNSEPLHLFETYFINNIEIDDKDVSLCENVLIIVTMS